VKVTGRIFLDQRIEAAPARYSRDSRGGERVMKDVRARMIEFLPRLRRFAYALTGDPNQGDDLVHETCMHALSRVDQFQFGTRLDSWMFQIAQNIWLDRARSREARGGVLSIEDNVAVTNERDVLESRLPLETVNRAISQLPADQQVLLTLVCVDGLSYKETADIMNVSVATVMARLSHARRSLMALVESKMVQGGGQS
jgi:RNA polymerase sigma-70 factor, ECF subfamily